MASLAACASQTGTGTLPPGTPGGAIAQSAASHATAQFQTIDVKEKQFHFTQLLGISNAKRIVGYYGDGTKFPNVGVVIEPPWGARDVTIQNYPHAVQTQVTGQNGEDDTVGFWVDQAGNNFGWIRWQGAFKTYIFPGTKGLVNQLLGINDAGLAVGFYTDGKMMNHGYTYNRNTKAFAELVVANGTNVMVAAVNHSNDIAGSYTDTKTKHFVSFIRKGSRFYTFKYPGATDTQAFGLNRHDDMAGVYTDKSGTMHGFLVRNALGTPRWSSYDYPGSAKGTTFINGLNDNDWMVGFYNDSKGATHGMLIEP